MAERMGLDQLAAGALREMERLGYSESTRTGFRRMFAAFSRHVGERGADGFDESMAVEFLNERYGAGLERLYQNNPGGTYLKSWLRAMRILAEFEACGSICKRMPGELRRTALPAGLEALLESFNAASRASGHSESTVYSRGNRVKRFLLFLAGRGGEDASCIDASSAHDYVLTKASCHAKTVAAILTVLRCFLRHLYLEGLTADDLSGTVPSPKPHYAPSLPEAWGEGDVERLMSSIDRGNPVGKRDYAMLLMVARLGLRASDIKAIRTSDLDWEGRTISIVQHKTGVPLRLPLLPDVGWAVIDYLRRGRPEGAACPELFVRMRAPFDPFTQTSNLTYILANRAREAGVKAPRDRRTLHSLRHALAKRLMDQGAPLEDISRILGHVSTRTTAIYLRMDVEQLRACALDPEEVRP